MSVIQEREERGDSDIEEEPVWCVGYLSYVKIYPISTLHLPIAHSLL